ncbi:hypothetical protein [Jannaschia sp. 2305UL9-9]|uniref:hypothetical protein n=1 Tax=Jannaschia sp. 2305UL9-9 TaxID=3121638 RepID=UPI0035282397
MYTSDSLFTLTPLQIVGVLFLSGVMWLGAVRLLRSGPGRLRRTGLAIVLFHGFVWLSPQVYYLFYWATFDGLPMQWVIRAPPSPGHLLRLLTFTEEASLSRHGQGLFGWSLLLLALRSSGSGVRP